MRDQRDDDVNALWAAGDMMFRVTGSGHEPDRLVKVRRPFALIGRSPDADISIDDKAASARHAYLHLDPRGVYAVDLVTRTGTHINGSSRMSGWLRPGDWVEVAGRKIQLLRIRINGVSVEPGPCEDDLLADTDRDALPTLSLEPRPAADSPWLLGSELVFLGWSASCGIQIKDTSVARTHCAIVRSQAGAFLVDLYGKQTWVEEHEVKGATPLSNGDMIMIGSTQFTVRVEPPPQPANDHLPGLLPRHEASGLPAVFRDRVVGVSPAAFEVPALPFNTEMIPVEAQGAIFAWVMGTIQGTQVEVLRRQGEFQMAMTEALRQIQQNSTTLLNAHLERIEGIDRELASLRAEMERRNTSHYPPPPDVTPLRIARSAPAPTTPEPGSPDAPASTAWILKRVSQLEDENRSAWKDLLGKLSQSRKAT